MKHTQLMLALIIAALTLTLVACGGDNQPADTEAPTDTPAVTEGITQAETEDTESENMSGTQAETPPETQPETIPETLPETTSESVAETVTETQPETGPETVPETVPETETEPVILPDGLSVVGKSYDGKYACYNGTYDFGYTVCASGGQSFSSVQACVDYLATRGGGEILIKADLDICLAINIPDDGNVYKIYYNNYNCDFVFNHGFIYDDSVVYADVDVIPGLAYYSSLSALDSIGGLENTGVWVCSDDHDTLEMGRYAMLAKEEGDTTNYHYEKFSDMDAWYGLIEGEYLPS